MSPELTPLADLAHLSNRRLLMHIDDWWDDEPKLCEVQQEVIRRIELGRLQESSKTRSIRARLEELVCSERVLRWPERAICKEREALNGQWYQMPEEGMLGFFGYHVGRVRGIAPAQRQEILDYVFRGELPLIESESYMARWGAPSSSERLREIASSIVRFAQRARGRIQHDLEDALQEWAHDRAYLWRRYYDKHRSQHRWTWPRID